VDRPREGERPRRWGAKGQRYSSGSLNTDFVLHSSRCGKAEAGLIWRMSEEEPQK